MNIGPHPEIIIAINPSTPAAYWIFDPRTATICPTEHRFHDDLKIDFASLNPSLDPDGVSYNCCVSFALLLSLHICSFSGFVYASVCFFRDPAAPPPPFFYCI